MRNGWKLMIVAGVVAGCGSCVVQEGDGVSTPPPATSVSATPTNTLPLPVASPPGYQGAFTSAVQPFLTKAGCGVTACHLPPTGQAGVNLFTAGTVTATQMSDNALNL